MYKKLTVLYDDTLKAHLEKKAIVSLKNSAAMAYMLDWISEFQKQTIQLETYHRPSWMHKEHLAVCPRLLNFFDEDGKWKVREEILSAFREAHRIECVLEYRPKEQIKNGQADAIVLSVAWYRSAQKHSFESLCFGIWICSGSRGPAGSAIRHLHDSFGPHRIGVGFPDDY